MKTHTYQVQLQWTGNQGSGTNSYRTYSRDHEHSSPSKTIAIPGSSDPAFRGDPSRYNPEELLLASVASCHMLWFLHLCSANGVIVIAYDDAPTGEMAEQSNGSGQFTGITLHPRVQVAEEGMIAQVDALHKEAHALCFIANSVNFPIHHAGTCRV